MNTRTDTRPNIVLLFPDQWRHDALSVLGHPVAETPFLDQIAHQGVRFTSAYSPAPTCIATRASLATGCSPNTCGRIGYRDFVPWTYPDTFMRLLRDGGYQTLCAGKTHFHPARARLGFEELALYEVEWQMPGEPSDYHRFLLRETGGRVQDSATTHDSNSMHAVPWTHDENLHATNWTVGAALEMLERRDPQRPFFLQVCPHRPHPPFDPPLTWFERFANAELPDPPVGDWATEGGHPATTIDAYGGQVPKKTFDRNRRAYYAQLAHLDNQFCRLWRFLKGRKLLANTWIFFMSDHGEFLGDHHLFRKTAPSCRATSPATCRSRWRTSPRRSSTSPASPPPPRWKGARCSRTSPRPTPRRRPMNSSTSSTRPNGRPSPTARPSTSGIRSRAANGSSISWRIRRSATT